MNSNRQRNKGIHQRTNNQNQVKKVRFDTSQQWRLSRRQIQANSPNRNVIQKNLSMIKSGATPLKRAQAAYYGKKTNRSPLLATTSQVTVKTEIDDNEKLPVHARLGTRPVLKTTNLRNNIVQKKPPVKLNTVQELLAQKRALRMRTIQQSKKLRQLQALSKRINTGGTLRSDQLLRTQTLNPRIPRKNIRNRPNRQLNGLATAAAADLSVSVANDLALERQLLNGGFTINRSNNRRRLNRPPLHSSEVDPQIQREISMIQERSRRRNLGPLAAPDIPTQINPITTIHPLTTTSLNPINRTESVPPLTQLGGITSITVPVENRPRLSLHERFSRL